MDSDDPFGILADKDNEKEQKSVIENREKLKITHIPDQLKFREEEIHSLVTYVFEPALDGHEGTDVVITGKPGTGKTAVVRYVQQKVHESYDTSKMEYAYVNCKTDNSQQEVFKAIMNSIGMDYKRGVGVSQNIEKLFKKFSDPDAPALVIVLDEVDELYKARRDYINDVVYTLSRSASSDNDDFEGDITLICVSNDNQLYNYLEKDVDGSSFTPARYEFLKYNVDEIAEILMARQDEAFSERIIDKPAMKEIAEVVSERFDGDIRVGIRILKKLPEYIDSLEIPQENRDQQEIVDKAIEDVKRNRIEKILNGKDEHFLLTMSAMIQNFKNDKSKLSYIVDSYRKACEMAALEKNKDDFGLKEDESRTKSRSYVRRKLEYLVDEGVLSKEKRYDKPRNPYFYEPEVEVELFEEMVNKRLERSGVTARFRDLISNSEKKARKEAENTLKQHMEVDN